MSHKEYNRKGRISDESNQVLILLTPFQLANLISSKVR